MWGQVADAGAGATRPIGLALVPLSIAAFAWALGHLRASDRHRGKSPPPLWFGYARDGINLAAVAVTFGALVFAGIAPPLALLGSFCLTLLCYILDYALGRALGLPGASWIAAALTAACTAPLWITPARATASLGEVLAWLF